MVSDVVDRYRDALQSGDQATLDAWAATGAEGVDVLRRELERPTIQPATGGHDREAVPAPSPAAEPQP